MKLNWGHYILLSFIGFVLLILFMVFKSYQHTNDLVAEDYYAKEIQFQDVIDKKARANDLPENVEWSSTNAGVLVQFPEMSDAIEGKILLFRPSDKNKDIEVDISLNSENQQLIDSGSLISGKYLVQIDWKSGDQTYYTEGSVFVQR